MYQSYFTLRLRASFHCRARCSTRWSQRRNSLSIANVCGLSEYTSQQHPRNPTTGWECKVEVKQTSRLFQYEDMASIIDMEPARQKDWLRSTSTWYRLKSMPSVPTKSSRKSLNWISRTPSKANNMETKPENACLSRSIFSTEAFTVRTTRRTHSKHSNQLWLSRYR